MRYISKRTVILIKLKFLWRVLCLASYFYLTRTAPSKEVFDLYLSLDFCRKSWWELPERELTLRQRWNSLLINKWPSPLLHYQYLCTSPSLYFHQKKLPIVSTIIDDKRDLPFAVALRSSLPSGSSLSSSTVNREILFPGCTTSSFKLYRTSLWVAPSDRTATTYETFPKFL